MSELSAVDVIAEAIREHHFLTELQSDGTKLYHCGKCCGETVCLAHSVEDYRAHVARHARDALEAAGWATGLMLNSTVFGRSVSRAVLDAITETHAVVELQDVRGLNFTHEDGTPYTPKDLRFFAGEALAAANAAESGSTTPENKGVSSEDHLQV